ncbi:cysteine hydrolase family protein [Siminovitchia fortis]|uniref:Cysteine hydrolase n=1 Tax=Siminovitchia fortis TaxID=254758 RepID=A0A443IJW5_9BACI|nr:cysteine hydrolase family protein [Siminovitchia fortis]RWR05032.1 cysteine hydrolase [Siminovitchia fortis]WHY81995.1 cysteine hydrolase family protein [Siminovitchia fortis]
MEPMLENPVLVMVDVQKRFEEEKWGERNNLQAEKNIERLLLIWRSKHLPIIHVQHLSRDPDSSFYPGKPGVDFMEFAKPLKGEMVIQKRVNSAFIGTNLEEYLKQKSLNHVVIVGLTTPHCVSTTTRMSANLGFNTFLISDATAAFGMTGPDGIYYSPDEIHNISIATLHEEFASVLTTGELMNRLN